MKSVFIKGCLLSFLSGTVFAEQQPLEKIKLSENGRYFVLSGSMCEFAAWGFNYDHALGGQLVEDYWVDQWDKVEKHFKDMKALGANTVRIHLQFGKFMLSPRQANEQSLIRLAMLVELAERTGLYLNITGLGCYHKQDVPGWYDEMDEAARWEVQAQFWENIAKTCAGRPAVFCYDLMNEPVITEGDDWLPGDGLDGKFFVQRITRDMKGRSREEIAEQWVRKLVKAIKAHDSETLITVGVIPWAHVWPNAKPVFYAEQAAKYLDFVSVHFYPKRDSVDSAIEALSVYSIGKPLVVEEMFTLHCDIDELNEFIERSKGTANGWLGFFWGENIEELRSIVKDLPKDPSPANGVSLSEEELAEELQKKTAKVMTLRWLEYFVDKTPSIIPECN